MPTHVNPILKSSPFGVMVRTWATSNDLNNSGIRGFLDSHFYGAGHGHVSFEMRLPVNTYTKELLEKYCSDIQTYANGYTKRLIPYKKEFITNPDGSVTECYVVYFSWWLMLGGLDAKTGLPLHDIVESYSESRRVRLRAGLSDKDDKILDKKESTEDRIIKGILGERKITQSPELRAKSLDTIPDELKIYLDLLLKEVELQSKINSITMLNGKILKDHQGLLWAKDGSGWKFTRSKKLSSSEYLLIRNTLGKSALSYVSSSKVISPENLMKIYNEIQKVSSLVKDELMKTREALKKQDDNLSGSFDYVTQVFSTEDAMFLKYKEILDKSNELSHKIGELKKQNEELKTLIANLVKECNKTKERIKQVLSTKESLFILAFSKKSSCDQEIKDCHLKLKDLEEKIGSSSKESQGCYIELKKMEEELAEMSAEEIKQQMLRNLMEKHLEIGRAADNEVLLPLSESEFGSENGHKLGMNIEEMLLEMRRLRLTEHYDFYKKNCAITGRRVLAAGCTTPALRKLAKYVAPYSIDNPQLVHTAATLLKLYQDGKLSKVYEFLPKKLSLTETLMGILVDNYLEMISTTNKEIKLNDNPNTLQRILHILVTNVFNDINIAKYKFYLRVAFLAPSLAIVAISTGFFNPTQGIIACYDWIKYAMENDSTVLKLTSVIFMPIAMMIYTPPAMIEITIKLSLLLIESLLMKLNEILTSALEQVKKIDFHSQVTPEKASLPDKHARQSFVGPKKRAIPKLVPSVAGAGVIQPIIRGTKKHKGGMTTVATTKGRCMVRKL